MSEVVGYGFMYSLIVGEAFTMLFVITCSESKSLRNPLSMLQYCSCDVRLHLCLNLLQPPYGWDWSMLPPWSGSYLNIAAFYQLCA